MPSYGRVIDAHVYVDWNFDTTYTDESARLISATGNIRFAPPESAIFSPRGTADRCLITLDNRDGRYSALLTSGALYSDLTGGGAYHAPMYIEVSIDGGANYYRVFTGVVKIPDESTPTARRVGNITLDCRSSEEAILSKRQSTLRSDFASYYDTGKTEAEIMEEFLTDAGIAAGKQALDDGLFIIPFAWLDRESPVEACWSLAAACGGRFYVDVNGNYTYENAFHWLLSPHTSSQATISRDTYRSLRPYYDDRELYEGVVVKATPRYIDGQATLYQSDTVYTVPANTTGGDTVQVTVELDAPAYAIDAPTYSAVTFGGSDLSANVTTAITYYANVVQIQFQNSHTEKAAQIVGLTVTGRSVGASEEFDKGQTSADSFWTSREGRDRVLSGNRWIQTQAQVNYLSDFLLDRHETPRLFFQIEGYRGSPQRKLGDRVTINDSKIMTSSRDAFVIGIDWRYSAGSFSQDLLCVDATDLYTYISSSPGYFVLGTNKLGAADPDRARIFY